MAIVFNRAAPVQQDVMLAQVRCLKDYWEARNNYEALHGPTVTAPRTKPTPATPSPERKRGGPPTVWRTPHVDPQFQPQRDPPCSPAPAPATTRQPLRPSRLDSNRPQKNRRRNARRQAGKALRLPVARGITRLPEASPPPPLQPVQPLAALSPSGDGLFWGTPRPAKRLRLLRPPVAPPQGHHPGEDRYLCPSTPAEAGCLASPVSGLDNIPSPPPLSATLRWLRLVGTADQNEGMPGVDGVPFVPPLATTSWRYQPH